MITAQLPRLWNRLWKLHARVLRRVSHYRWFGVLGKHVVSPMDRAVIKASRGRLSMTGPEFTTMLLTTTGRKSGKQRTVPVYYVPDGKKLVWASNRNGKAPHETNVFIGDWTP